MTIDPFPAGSLSRGNPLLRRMRVGAYRVWFGVEKDVVRIVRLARSPYE